MKPVLRAAHAGDYEHLYGHGQPCTIRAYTAELDGKPVGIGGLAYHPHQTLLFSKMTDELKPYKKFIVRCARLAGDLAREAGAPAVADRNHSLSCKLLERLGMVFVAETPEGGVFKWRAG